MPRGQTDGHYEANTRFSKFLRKRPKMSIITIKGNTKTVYASIQTQSFIVRGQLVGPPVLNFIFVLSRDEC